MVADAVIRHGLEGVIAGESRLSYIDGLAGELVIGGYPLEAIAGRATFEEMIYLLWHDHLPNEAELEAFKRELIPYRYLPEATLSLLRACAEQGLSVMDALRMGADTLSLVKTESVEETVRLLIASFPTIVASYWRLLQGDEPIVPRDDLGHAENYLYMLSGDVPDDATTRALETYLNTVIDHGWNASTFTGRVIVSTDSDMVSAIVGAIGALKGPKHGGAPGPALEMVFEIGSADRAEPIIRQKLENQERLMGFGHRVYKVYDPRAQVLGQEAERFFVEGEKLALYQLAKHVEQTALRLLEEYKPGRICKRMWSSIRH